MRSHGSRSIPKRKQFEFEKYISIPDIYPRLKSTESNLCENGREKTSLVNPNFRFSPMLTTLCNKNQIGAVTTSFFTKDKPRMTLLEQLKSKESKPIEEKGIYNKYFPKKKSGEKKILMC